MCVDFVGTKIGNGNDIVLQQFVYLFTYTVQRLVTFGTPTFQTQLRTGHNKGTKTLMQTEFEQNTKSNA